MADTAVRAARKLKVTVVLLDASGGVTSSCTPPIPGAVSTVTHCHAVVTKEGELVEVH